MTNDGSNSIKAHPVVSHEEWLSARTAFLAKEKEFTRQRDELSRQRRELPWEKVDKQYVFDGPSGKETLAELFENRSQLIVYHFMFAPDWDEGCPHCSFWADNFNGIGVHLWSDPHRPDKGHREVFPTGVDAISNSVGGTYPKLECNRLVL
jgi:predicted dithiol-disulfide oxidoreductase (DUF899 family)